MRKIWIFLVLVAVFVSACAGEPSPTRTAETSKTAMFTTQPPAAEPTNTVPLTTVPGEEPATLPATIPVPTPADHAGLPLPADRGAFFAGSGLCAVCHTNMADESNMDVSIDSIWRSTMMGNSARDPYWQASFRAEVLANPDYQEVIEDKCTTCHTPMARFTSSTSGVMGKAFDDGFFNAGHELHILALDGISCTLCHQIGETNFGQTESYSGKYVIDTDLPAGERTTFGPFPVADTQIAIMQGASGFVPEQSPHIQKSELCATCHTLYTPYLDAAGQIAGEFPEQTPYLEWLNSDYRETNSCQSCHMPIADGGVVLSTTGGEPRSPFHKHVFVGGNAYVLTLLQQYADQLGTTSSSAQFGATVERVLDQMQNRTATISLEDVAVSNSRLNATVVIDTQVGHKFPTGYPARRVWLHFTIRDADGRVIFESGAFGPDGSIVHNENDTSPTSYEPHYAVVDSPDKVQVYEAIMGNTEGEATTTLLRGAGYLKDNRLLPIGFDPGSDSDVAVHGAAADDDDFAAGGDRVLYDVPLGDSRGPFSVTAELLYQSISYRWVDNLRRSQATETDRLLGYYEDVPNLPLLIASATAEIGN